MRKKYEIPLGTKLEIVSKGYSDNGRIGTLGAKDPDGLPAYNVWFGDEEFDCFMDDQFIPIQNIIIIDNLEYETLCKVFEHNYIYDTDRIIVKQKEFTETEIGAVLEKYASLLAKIFSKDTDFEENGICLDNRGKVLALLQSMLNDNYGDCDSKMATAIEEAVMYEQWQIEGFRKHLTWNGKDKKPLRYFNPEANIETIFV